MLQSFFLLAQPNCQLTISGVVLDTDTHEPLLYTNIVVVELNKVAIANDNGQYTIDSLCAGTYTLTCSHLGCETVSQILHLTQNTTLNFNLPHATNTLHEVVIKSERTNAPISQVRNELNKRQLDEVKGKSLGERLWLILMALAPTNRANYCKTSYQWLAQPTNTYHEQWRKTRRSNSGEQNMPPKLTHLPPAN
ncbi:MAG: carboxypeptidase-like regulatory domain-containing protein [Sphingobacteriales bacterium]|nr:carboxypeptidase-like regulatory domain-containing protein [Sphingobacteriales bacterium]